MVVPIGLFFGRIANFVNGELWGRIAPDFPYAIVFPTGGPLPRHPSQLYEAATEGLLLFIVMAICAYRFGFRKPGLLGGIFVLGYALARTGCEFFREPDAQLGFLFGNGSRPDGRGRDHGDAALRADGAGRPHLHRTRGDRAHPPEENGRPETVEEARATGAPGRDTART